MFWAYVKAFLEYVLGECRACPVPDLVTGRTGPVIDTAL